MTSKTKGKSSDLPMQFSGGVRLAKVGNLWIRTCELHQEYTISRWVSEALTSVGFRTTTSAVTHTYCRAPKDYAHLLTSPPLIGKLSREESREVPATNKQRVLLPLAELPLLIGLHLQKHRVSDAIVEAVGISKVKYQKHPVKAKVGQLIQE